MENAIQIFNNEQFGAIRTIEENGKVLFCGSDVAKALGYSIPSKAVNTHCKGVSKMEVPTNGGNQTMLFIPEGDVYRLITHSKLPAAEQFEHWVFDEVLPTLRKEGSYIMAKQQAKAQLLMSIYEGGQDAIIASKKLSELEVEEATEPLIQKIETDKPFVEFADHVSYTTSLIDIGELAKLAKKEHIDIGRNRLMQWLRNENYLMDSYEHKNQPYQKYIDQGLFSVLEYSFTTPYGKQTALKTCVTGKGQIYIIEKLRKIFGENSEEKQIATAI